MSRFTLTDAAIERALAPGFDVAAPADFTEQISIAIAAQPRRSRLWLLNPAAWSRQSPLMTQMILLLLLLALLIGAVAVASLPRKAFANGDVIVASGAELLEVDPETGVSRSLLTGEGDIFGVTRSDDGQLISFWTETPAEGTTLEVSDATGGERRRLAENVIPRPVGEGQIDVWSPDRRSLAAGVLVDGQQRILLVDIPSGSGEFIGPIGAANPLWSPDGQLLAFSLEREGHSVLAVMHPDGSGLRVVSGDLTGFNVGANNWSPDGVWVYFGAERNNFNESHIYRAHVEESYSEQLTFDLVTAAPALSPDGTKVAYSEWERGVGIQNLNIMDADGGNQRRLLDTALNYGWSNDGQFLLAEWRPAGNAFELLILRPDGTGRRTLMTFAGGCVTACAPSLGWGQPRP